MIDSVMGKPRPQTSLTWLELRKASFEPSTSLLILRIDVLILQRPQLINQRIIERPALASQSPSKQTFPSFCNETTGFVTRHLDLDTQQHRSGNRALIVHPSSIIGPKRNSRIAFPCPRCFFPLVPGAFFFSFGNWTSIALLFQYREFTPVIHLS